MCVFCVQSCLIASTNLIFVYFCILGKFVIQKFIQSGVCWYFPANKMSTEVFRLFQLFLIGTFDLMFVSSVCSCREPTMIPSGLKTCWSSTRPESEMSKSWRAWTFTDPQTSRTPALWASRPTCTPLRKTTECTETYRMWPLVRGPAFPLHIHWTDGAELFYF